MVSVHWSTLLNHSHCLLGKVVGMHMKNSAMRFVQEEKKVKAENTEWAGRKKRRRTKKFVSATPSALPCSSWILLSSFSSLTYRLVLVLFFRISFTISQMCKGMGWWRSLMPKEMMHGRCILMRQPKRSWMNLQCVMALSQYTRPWRKMHFLSSLVLIIGITDGCQLSLFSRWSVLIMESLAAAAAPHGSYCEWEETSWLLITSVLKV